MRPGHPTNSKIRCKELQLGAGDGGLGVGKDLCVPGTGESFHW